MTAFLRFLALFSGAGLGSVVCAGDPESASFHFAHEVAPILAKAGCSAAECHGGAAGKGGFKLSLFSSDPRADFNAITREFGARRVDFVSPENSLLLRKPSRQLKHGGGKVLPQTETAFRKLHRWLEAGAPWSTGEPLALRNLRIAEYDDSLAAIAEFESGETRIERDVTDLAMLNSSDPGVASVDPDGSLYRKGPGETWILARYGHLSARLPVLIPFGEWKSPSDNLSRIDRVWLDRLESLGIAPADPAPDSVLLRRLHFDLAGRPPSLLETTGFSSAAKTVDALLDSEDFSRTWARHLGDWFEVPIAERDPRNGKEANESVRRFLRESMDRRASAAEIARRMLIEPDPQLAWKRFSDPRDRAEYIGRSLLGMRIGCARCHNHPLDRWKQEEHLQFSAFFSDDRPNPDGGPMMPGKFFEPETGRAIQPALLPLTAGSPPSRSSRQEKLAWFVLDADHDQFARNIANRVFGVMIGQPLVNSPDDHRLSNPAIHEPLLDLLTEILIDSGYDLRVLVREIANSKLYALSSESGDPIELKYFARRESRRLSADDYRRAVAFVTGVPLDHPLPPESPLAEQLYLMNSGLIPKSLAAPGNQIDALFDFGADMVEDLYLLILARRPTDAERNTFLPELRKIDNQRIRFEAPGISDNEDLRTRVKDLAFALIASREFGFVR